MHFRWWFVKQHHPTVILRYRSHKRQWCFKKNFLCVKWHSALAKEPVKSYTVWTFLCLGPADKRNSDRYGLKAHKCLLVSGGAAIPESGSEVVAAGHEAGVGGWVDDTAHDVIVAQGEQVLPLGCAWIPAAQADGSLVRQQHIVLCVVENTLSAVRLSPTETRTCMTGNTKG